MDPIALAQTAADLLVWPLWGCALAGLVALVRPFVITFFRRR